MDLRLRNLEPLDARAVPLPHGTEVVTRVDRLVGERRVPQGTIGRVTKVEGDELDVTVVGVGVVRYARGELSPRRVALVLFAHRRTDAWEALRPASHAPSVRRPTCRSSCRRSAEVIGAPHKSTTSPWSR